MPNPTINVTLDSLNSGTVPSVTNSVNVAEGGNLDVTVTWPTTNSSGNTITVDLNFSESGDQDPFNNTDGGDTSFTLERTPPSLKATKTLAVESNATTTTDTYQLTLTINGQDYTKDPVIVIDDD